MSKFGNVVGKVGNVFKWVFRIADMIVFVRDMYNGMKQDRDQKDKEDTENYGGVPDQEKK